MVFNGTAYKDGEKFKNNTLYHTMKSRNFQVLETDDHFYDIVECTVRVNENEEAVFAKEYRAPYVNEHGFKKADIMCIIADGERRALTSYNYEIKHSVSGFERVLTVVGQWQGTATQIKSIIIGAGCEEWQECSHIGVITSGIAENRIKEQIKSKKDECAKGLIFDSKLNSVVSKKIRNKSLPRLKEIQVVKDFLDGMAEIQGEMLEIDKIKLIEEDGKYLGSAVFTI